jgi:hypothetical protein
MTLRIIVTGNREWNDVATIREVLSCFHRGTIVVHGAASGADSIAHDLCNALGLVPEPHPAKWADHGRAAGPIRNREMIELGANGIVAFGDLFDGTKRRGTGDCLFEALRKGILGLVVPYGVKVAALRPLVQGLLFGGV